MDCMIRKSETKPCDKPGWVSRLSRRVLTIAAVGSLLSVATSARAACGSFSQIGAGKQAHPASWNMQSGRAYLSQVDEPLASIVGMWHVTFTAKGNSEGPPDNTPIDNAIIVWHSDRTEVMNSGRPAQDGDFCLGVWEEVVKNHYKLNHFAWMGNDTTNAPGGIGKPAGPTHIVEDVTVSADGKHYSGTFTLDAYDTSFNLTAHIVGVLQGTRITMGTTVDDLM
jgi:hypothetical protein